MLYAKWSKVLFVGCNWSISIHSSSVFSYGSPLFVAVIVIDFGVSKVFAKCPFQETGF